MCGASGTLSKISGTSSPWCAPHLPPSIGVRQSSWNTQVRSALIGSAARRSASITWPRHERDAVVAAKNTSAGEYAGYIRRYAAITSPRSSVPMNGEFASSLARSVSQVSAKIDGSPRPMSVRVSSCVLPSTIGRRADCGGASGSNGSRGSDRPSFTGPR